MGNALAEQDTLGVGEFKQGLFSGGQGDASLRKKTHGVEAVEYVFGGVHDAAIGCVGEGAAEFEFGLCCAAEGF